MTTAGRRAILLLSVFCSVVLLGASSGCQVASEPAAPAGLVAEVIANPLPAALAIDEAQGLNVLIHFSDDAVAARVAALNNIPASQRRAMHGVALVVKDNIHVAGLPNSAGSPALLNFVPPRHNPVVERLLAAGVIVLGKANMHELAFGVTSNNAHFGPVRNPLDRTRFAGGSSGGTAAAIAAGMVRVGLGTDTGGSLRIPAALTGVVGFRPTTGRYPVGAVTPISLTRDTVGPMGQRVADVVLMDAVVTGQRPATSANLQGVRLGLAKSVLLADLDPETRRLFEAALVRLRAAGVVLVDAEIPNLGGLIEQTGFPIALYEAPRDLRNYLQINSIDLSFAQLVAGVVSPDVRSILQPLMAKSFPQAGYDAALVALAQLRKTYASYLERHQLEGILFPTTPLPAQPIATSDTNVTLGGKQVPTFPTLSRNTDLASLVAAPGLSIPAGLTREGLAVGLELDGAPGDDRRVLALGLAIEAALKSGS